MSRNKEVIDRIMRQSTDTLAMPQAMDEDARRLLQRDAQRAPWSVLSVLLGLFVWLVISDTLKDAVKCGGAMYWIFVLSLIPVVMVIMLTVRRFLIHKAWVKEQVRRLHGGLPPLEVDAR
jgi:hypothetical protein